MSETGRDAAACGLCILTHMPDACRKILKVLRVRPFVGYMLLQYTKLEKTSYEFQTRWKNMKAMHLPEINSDQIELLRHVKYHDRTLALVETQITWNKALMASFARHLRSASGSRERTGSSRSSRSVGFTIDRSQSVSKSSRYSIKSDAK